MLKKSFSPKLLFVVLVVFAIFAGSVFFITRLKKPSALPQEAPKVSRPENKSVVLADAVYADLAVRHQLDNVSIFYFDGNPQNNIAINPQRPWIPASTIKIYVAMYAFNQAAGGKLNLADAVTIDSANTVPSEFDTPDSPALVEGQVRSIYNLIYMMISQSDNTAYNTLLDILDRREITKYVHDLGMVHTSIGSKFNLDANQVKSEYQTPGFGDNVTTADDYATAFILIKGNRIPGASDLFTILSQQKINNMIPLMLPKEVVIAHKTGDLDPLYHDGGIIISANSSYVLSIFSNLGNPNTVAHISKLIYTKDVNLVGLEIKTKETTEIKPEEQTLDPLVLNPPSDMVLGESTQNVPVPSMTAADLGITAEDLSLEIQKIDLPKIVIPTSSRFRFLIPTWLGLVKAMSIFPASRVSADMLDLKYQLAEANQFLKDGDRDEANNILAMVDTKLAEAVKNKAVEGNPNLQNMAQSISETRFSIMGDDLKDLRGDKKLQAIKVIADQARNRMKNIQPYIPKAVSAYNTSQNPIVGEVVGKSGGALVVQTASGQKISLPANQEVKTREEGIGQAVTQKLSEIPIGTTVAIVGSATGTNRVTPSFVLKNLPKQLSAPQPTRVLKVNTINSTMVVSENGVPVQVNLTPQTSIRGNDTDVSLEDVKSGDVVIVRGTAAAPSTAASPKVTSAPTSASVNPTISTAPSAGQSANKPVPKNIPTSAAKPKVIEGRTIQVLEKSTSTSKSAPKKEEKKESKPPLTLPPSTPKPTEENKEKK